MNRSSLNVIQVAPLPPPIGGVSMHVQTLSAALRERGHCALNIDYARFGQLCKALPRVIIMLVCGWVGHSQRPMLHIHASAAERLQSFRLALAFLRKRIPCVLTVHSGSVVRRLIEDKDRNHLVRLFALFDQIIVVSDEIKQVLTAAEPSVMTKVSVIPAYIPAHIDTKASGRDERGGRVVASGYGTELYGWRELVTALQELGEASRIDLVMYNKFDVEYIREVKRLVGDDPRFVFHENLDHLDFLSLLARCEVFVRPTRTDGDSIAVREALDQACVVVASDSVRRPEGCMIYEWGNHNALVEAMKMALSGGVGRGGVATAQRVNFTDEVIAVYRKSLSRSDFKTDGDEKKNGDESSR